MGTDDLVAAYNSAFYHQILKSESSTVTFSLMLPADFPVGSYHAVIEVVPQHSKQGQRQEAERSIVVLFNPWCEGVLRRLQ